MLSGRVRAHDFNHSAMLFFLEDLMLAWFLRDKDTLGNKDKRCKGKRDLKGAIML